MGKPMENYGKMAPISQKIIVEQSFQLLTPPKFGSPIFQVPSVDRNRKVTSANMNNVKMAPNFYRAKLPIPQPPLLSLGLHFSSVNRNVKLVLAIIQKWLPFVEKL